MSLKTVWGIFPVIVLHMPANSQASGTANGPIIKLAPEAPEKQKITLAHELLHAKQFYAMAIAIVIIASLASVYSYLLLLGITLLAAWRFTKHSTLVLEAAAYGENARQLVALGQPEDKVISRLATILYNSELYSLNTSYEDVKTRIYKRYKDKRIF